MTRDRFAALSLALAWAVGLSACDSDFAPYNRLTGLRVLAIQSDPVRPGPGETARLTPLLHVPEGDVAALRWSWCPVVGDPGDGSPCLVAEEEAATALGDAALPSFELGEAETATFTHVFEPSLLERWCTGGVGSAGSLVVPDCSDGFPIQIRLVVRTESDEVVSYRRLLMRFAESHAANQNPELGALSASFEGSLLLLDETSLATLPRGVETPLVAELPDASSEPYTELDNLGEVLGTRERLVLTWFVEAGETRDERTSFIDGVSSLDEARVNTWTTPSVEEHAPGDARLVVVVRDDRGGVGWRGARVALGDGL